MDRRKRKSRQAMLEACLTLSKEKDMQQITINDIVHTADLNRGTFYLHFTDKAHMLKSFEQEMLEKIEQVLLANVTNMHDIDAFIESRYNTAIQIIRCYEDNKQLLQFVLTLGNSASFQAALNEQIKHIFTQFFIPKLNIDDLAVPIDLIIMIITSLSFSIAQFAYQSEEPIDVEAYGQFVIQLLSQGPLKALGYVAEV
ncbi:MAG: TetR/AcrR family transcriptional regulator [Caryophanon sp.]|nr:TetR/AcrR family transcriptional regulator [Caryophanon sp.]